MPEPDPARATGALTRLEALLRRDPGGRGLAAHAPPAALAGAARALAGARRVLIVTGFPVLTGEGPRPETDGPPGARALGDALAALGAEVTYLTDSVCARVLEATGCAPLEVLDLLPGDPRAAALLTRLAPTHLVSIERPGRARDGAYRDMRGRVLAVAALDEPFVLAPARGITTLAIGDGGNECGLAPLRAAVDARVAHGEAIACAVASDHPLAAGVSTWGAWILTGALAALAGRPELVPTPEGARALLEAAVAAGAVDGVTCRAEPTLDGRPWAESAALLTEIAAAAA